MPTDPKWLSAREDRAWRAFKHAGYQLDLRLHRHLLEDSRLTQADYEVLVVLSEHSDDRMPARELCATLTWEKSRLSHQIRGMEKRGLIARGPNPDDARSVMICLLPAGRRAIEDAAPAHVGHVRRHLIDLFTPGELETFATLNERILRHLAERPFPEERVPADCLPEERVPEDCLPEEPAPEEPAPEEPAPEEPAPEEPAPGKPAGHR